MSLSYRFLTLIKAALSLGLLAWLISRAELGDLADTFRQAYLPLLVLTFSMFYIGYIITASRWQLLLRVQGTSLPLSYLLQSFMVSVFFNNFLPSTVGGDIVRFYDSWRAGSDKAGALAAVLLDRLLGLNALAIFACIGLFFGTEFLAKNSLVGPAVTLFAIATFILVLMIFFAPLRLVRLVRSVIMVLPQPMRRIGERLADAAMLFHGRSMVFVIGLGLSLLLQGNNILFHFLVGMALGLPLQLTDYVLFVPLALVLMFLPITINGIGLREGVFTVFFGYYGLGVTEALAFSWLIYGQTLLQGLIGGLVYAVRRESFSHLRTQPSEKRVPD